MNKLTLMAATGTLATAGSVFGQCQPHWDTAPGNPGISGGYAAPVRDWSDGKVYIGGSFTAAGGSSTNAYLARWDPATNTWSHPGSGISPGNTNAFIAAITPYNPGPGERLIVGGQTGGAGGVAATASLAAWNGTAWESMGTGWTSNARGVVWAMTVWNGRLYVGGQPLSNGMIGAAPWTGIASWDGTGWTSLSSGTGGSFSPYIDAMSVFDDGTGQALYVGGRFSSIDGVPGTSLVARWNGSAWSSVGDGLTSTSVLFGIEGLTVFNDGTGAALYAAGYAFIPPGQPVCNVAKWDGHTWTAIGGQLGTGRLTSITGFDDGAGPKLYIGGTAMPQFNYVARWENGAWTPVGGGVTGPALPPSNFPSVFGVNMAQGKLYVAGDFTQVNMMGSNGLAAWAGCASTCYANCDNSTTTPILNVGDFVCFQSAFAAGASYANCDGSTTPPVLNIADFVCFQSAFAAGCP